jgi:putative ABC transport system permease protein
MTPFAYSVAQRRQEIGIRRALGAQRGEALALTRLMNTLLFRVSATDPATFVTIALLFVIVTLSASYVPARRALRVDPMAALRYE